jgi:hypothetical protein
MLTGYIAYSTVCNKQSETVRCSGIHFGLELILVTVYVGIFIYRAEGVSK